MNDKIDAHVGPMSTASGLNLSVTALRNLRHLLSGSDDIEEVNASEINVVEEVLGVEHDLAARIWAYPHFPWTKGKLEDVEGMTVELAAEIRHKIVVREPGD